MPQDQKIDFPGADENWADELHGIKEELDASKTQIIPVGVTVEYDEETERHRRYLAFVMSVGWVTTFAEIGGSALVAINKAAPEDMQRMVDALKTHVRTINDYVRRDLPMMQYKPVRKKRV